MSLAADAPAGAIDRHAVRTLLLAALGGALEFYDFVVFVFFTKVLGQLFFPADMPAWLAQLQVFGIFAAGYLVRPLGGLVMAHFGDTRGRKRMFTLSVLLMALPTLAIGLLPVYTQIGVLAPILLLAARMVQGVAIGGEVPGAWVFVAEHARAGRVGFACALLTAGLSAGILLGSLMAAGLLGHLSPGQIQAYGWRIPFIAGGLFGFVAVWLRRWLAETPVFAAIRARAEHGRELPLKAVLRGQGAGVLVSMLLSWMVTAAIVVVILMTPTLVQGRFGLDAATAFRGNTLATLALCAGCLGIGWLADRIGRGPTLLLGALAMVASVYLLCLDLQAGGAHFLPLYVLAGLCSGVVGVTPSIMVEAFPPAVRFTGVSFAYNLTYALVGAVTPPLIAWSAQRLGPLAPAHYVALTGLIGALVALHLLRAGPAVRG